MKGKKGRKLGKGGSRGPRRKKLQHQLGADSTRSKKRTTGTSLMKERP